MALNKTANRVMACLRQRTTSVAVSPQTTQYEHEGTFWPQHSLAFPIRNEVLLLTYSTSEIHNTKHPKN